MQKITNMTYPNIIAENAKIDSKYAKEAKLLKEYMIEEFFELCKIPHPSGHVNEMREYIYEWGVNHNLKTTLDKSGCVYIDIPASKGCENYPNIIFQSHYDMVCVCSSDYVSYDKCKSPIIPYYDKEKGEITTKGLTSLGADDGQGIATSFAIARLHLNKDINMVHGPIRFLFTYDEETNMQGVKHLSDGAINAKYLINLDSICVGILLSSAAGAVYSSITKHMQQVNAKENSSKLTLKIWGLIGGHSGEDINKGRGNTTIITKDILIRLQEENIHFNFQQMESGKLMNSIPNKLNLCLIISTDDVDAAIKIIEDELKKAKEKYIDGHSLKYSIEHRIAYVTPMLNSFDTKTIFKILCAFPMEVIETFETGEPKTSCNVGYFSINDGVFVLKFLFRSVDWNTIKWYSDNIDIKSYENQMDYTIEGIFPAWPKITNNKLNNLFLESYKCACGFEGSTIDIHSGIECGYLSKKYPDLIMASVGCDLICEHTCKETLLTKSIETHMASILYVLEHID